MHAIYKFATRCSIQKIQCDKQWNYTINVIERWKVYEKMMNGERQQLLLPITHFCYFCMVHSFYLSFEHINALFKLDYMYWNHQMKTTSFTNHLSQSIFKHDWRASQNRRSASSYILSKSAPFARSLVQPTILLILIIIHWLFHPVCVIIYIYTSSSFLFHYWLDHTTHTHVWLH